MEPFKALTFLAAVGIASLVGAGAAGFYAGYSAGRGSLEEIKAQIANAPVVATSGGAISLKPVLEDIRALSKQVEALAAVQAHPAADANQGSKAVLEEVKALARQLEAEKAHPAVEPEQNSKPLLDEMKLLSRQLEGVKVRPAIEPEQNYKSVVEEIRALSKQVEALKARPAAGAEQAAKPMLDEIHALGRQIDSLKAMQAARTPGNLTAAAIPDYTQTLQNIRDQIGALSTKLDKQEPKAPKILVDEIHSLSASIQAQEPNARRIIAEEVRKAVLPLQNAEPRVPKALMDEIYTISANVRPDPRPQPSVSDQIKVLAASIESLKSRLAEESSSGRGDAGVGAEVAQLHQLVARASDQFGRCQMQLASLASSGLQQAQQSASATTTVAVTPSTHREPSTVVFYDNVMLRKDQEKQYDEIGVRLALQSVGARQVKVAVNRQGFGLAFGERKVFRSQDVECELNLMETNLNDSQARVSISCKR